MLLGHIQKRGYLRVGINYNNPPFGSLTKHSTSEANASYRAEGFDVDLSQAIAAALLPEGKHPIRFRQVLTSTRLVALNTQSVDLIAAAMSITEARRQRVDFSVPYFEVHQKMLVPKESLLIEVTGPIGKLRNALSGKTILTVNGSTTQARIQMLFPSARIKGYATLNEAFAGLQTGEGDALSNDDVLLSGLLQNHCDLQKKFRMLPYALSDESYGLAFRKSGQRPDSKSLQKSVNRILARFKKDGTLEKLKHRWLNPGNCRS